VPGFKTFTGFNGIKIDSTTNVNQLTFQVDTSRMIHATLAGIRGRTPDYSLEAVYLDDPLRSGIFYYDNTDVTTADDTAMTLVGPGGVRWKRRITTPFINVLWFGAAGDGTAQDYQINKAIQWIVNNSNSPTTTVYFPAGTYNLNSPILMINFNGTTWSQCTVNLLGQASNKNTSRGLVSIRPNYADRPAIAMQQCKNCSIRNMSLVGTYTYGGSLNQIQVDTLALPGWDNGSCRTNTITPYCGIAIDFASDSTVYTNNSDMYPGMHQYNIPGMNRAGSTVVDISDVSIGNFWVAAVITPSNQQNGDIIHFNNINVGSNAVGIAVGQAQSKDVRITGFMSWANIHTVFDNLTFGIRHGDGGGAIQVDGGNIAGNSYQLCYFYSRSFKSSFSHIYAEGLFKIGINLGIEAKFDNCDLNFATIATGLPYPDFFFNGDATFQSCQLRCYGYSTLPLILSGVGARFTAGDMNVAPIISNVNVAAGQTKPIFDGVNEYYGNAQIGPPFAGVLNTNNINSTFGSPLYPGKVTYIKSNGNEYTFTYNGDFERHMSLFPFQLKVNKSNWTAKFYAGSFDINFIRPGDMIVTDGLASYQEGLPMEAYPIGIVDSVNYTNDTVYLKNVAVGVNDGNSTNLYTCFTMNTSDQFVGNVAPGDTKITGVRMAGGGYPSFPTGTRLDAPMFYTGAFVKSCGHDTIYMSYNSLSADSAITNFHFMNGYPRIDMRSPAVPESSVNLASQNPLYGQSHFYYKPVSPQNQNPLSNYDQEEYFIPNAIYNGDTSVVKLKYTPLFSRSRGRAVPVGTTGQALSSNFQYGYIQRVNIDSLSNGYPHMTINDGTKTWSLANKADLSPTSQVTVNGVSNAGSTLAGFVALPNDTAFRIGGWLNITAYTSGNVVFAVSFTDETNTARTINLTPVGGSSSNVTATGYYLYPTVTIRAKGGTMVSTSITNSGGSFTATYNAGSTVTLIKN
jgi:hypothetical protein